MFLSLTEHCVEYLRLLSIFDIHDVSGVDPTSFFK